MTVKWDGNLGFTLQLRGSSQHDTSYARTDRLDTHIMCSLAGQLELACHQVHVLHELKLLNMVYNYGSSLDLFASQGAFCDIPALVDAPSCESIF